MYCYTKTQYYKTKTRRQGGFTLAEVLVVIAMTGILLALSVVSWNAMIRRQEQERFAKAFRWLLSEAREKAFMENTAVRLVVDWKDKGGGIAKSVSWHQLPCAHVMGPLSVERCPSKDCLWGGSCIPVSKSEALRVPAGIVLPSDWGEFCFLASTGKVSIDCTNEISISQWMRGPSYQEVKVEGRRPYKFYMSPISTYVEVINCNAEEAKEVDTYTPPAC